MKSHLRSLHGRLPAAVLPVIIVAAAGPVAASEPAGSRHALDRPDFPPAIVRCDPSYEVESR